MSPILVIHIAPPISSSLLSSPPPGRFSSLSPRSTFPRHPASVRASLSSSSFRARMYVCTSLPFLFRKRDIRGRNRKRHGRVSNRYSIAVSHTAGRDTTVENAFSVTRRTLYSCKVAPAAGTRFNHGNALRICSPPSPALRRVASSVQIGRASRTYAHKLSSVFFFFAIRENIRGRAAPFAEIFARGSSMSDICIYIHIYIMLPAEYVFS